MPTATAYLRGWFTEPAPTFELRQPGARWGTTQSRESRRTLRVTRLIQETPSTRTFVLESADGAEPLAYRAGQHLTLIVEINGTAHRRCYSFSSSPVSGESMAITVKRSATGLVSQHLHDHVRVGDTLTATEPTGQFVLPTDPAVARVVVMVAGGVGITPLVSLAETLLLEEPRTRVVLLTGNRMESEIIFRERLGALGARFAPRLDVRHTVDLASSAWDGTVGVLDGSRVLAMLGHPDADAYLVCGPETMMDDVCATLASAGVGRDRIHTERFAYAAARPVRIPEHAAHVTFAASGKRVTARPGQTILQVGLDAGVDLPYSCTMGGCGACKVKKSSGSVVASEPNCLTDSEREAGYILACCSYADTDLTIDHH